MRQAMFLFAVAVLITTSAGGESRVHADAKNPTYDDDVMPILKQACINCHGNEKQKGGLNLATFAAMIGLACTTAHAQDAALKTYTPEQIKQGAKLYAVNCAACHGARMANPEWAIDLRTFPRDERTRKLLSDLAEIHKDEDPRAEMWSKI